MEILIVAARSVKKKFLKKQLDVDYIIAVDGGYKNLKKLNIVPDITIGDFDSLDIDKVKGEKKIYSKEKDFTDIEAAIEYAISLNPKNIRIVGATGGRLDHFISLLYLIINRNVNIQIINEKNIIFVKEETFKLKKRKNMYFSIIPITEMILSIKGAKYNLHKHKVKPHESLTVSNEFIDDVIIEFKGKLLVILSKDSK